MDDHAGRCRRSHLLYTNLNESHYERLGLNNGSSVVWCTPVLCLQEHGALVFESRRFVELRKQTFWRQLTSNESTGMGIFYTLNVFCIQVRGADQLHFVSCRLSSPATGIDPLDGWQPSTVGCTVTAVPPSAV